MTVNERLFTLGTLDAFAAAVRRRDAQATLTILQVETMPADPKKYGY